MDLLLQPSTSSSAYDADLNEIIDGLDMDGVDEIDLSHILNPTYDKRILNTYFQRDATSLESSDVFSSDPFMFLPETNAIIKPLIESTTHIPISSFNSSPPTQTTQQTFASYWGHKRSLDDMITSNMTNLELPRPVLNVAPISRPINNNINVNIDLDEQDGENSKKRKMTPDEKAMKRKQQTRAASKLYRQRRKELEVQLSERLEQLEEEKRQLQEEKKAAEEVMSKLREENSMLRCKQKLNSEENARKRYSLLLKLQKQLTDKAGDDKLCETIEQVRECCVNCVNVGNCNLMSFINPASIQRLVSNGFFDEIKGDLTEKQDVFALVGKMKTELGSLLSSDQIAKIEAYAEDHDKQIGVVLEEREKILDCITRTFKEYQGSYDANDAVQAKNVLSCLDHLRSNFLSETSVWQNTMRHVLDDTLTPFQMANFLTRVEFQHRSVIQLNAFWCALNKSIKGDIKHEAGDA